MHAVHPVRSTRDIARMGGAQMLLAAHLLHVLFPSHSPSLSVRQTAAGCGEGVHLRTRQVSSGEASRTLQAAAQGALTGRRAGKGVMAEGGVANRHNWGRNGMHSNAERGRAEPSNSVLQIRVYSTVEERIRHFGNSPAGGGAKAARDRRSAIAGQTLISLWISAGLRADTSGVAYLH